MALPSDLLEILVGIRPQNLSIDKARNHLSISVHEWLGGVNYSYLIAPTGERIIFERKGVALPMARDFAVRFDPN